MLVLAVWTSARRLFLLAGEPLLRKDIYIFSFSFQGIFSSLLSELGAFSCFRQFGSKSSQSQIRGRNLAFSDVFALSQGCFVKPVCVTQALLQPPCPVFNRAEAST